MRKIRLNSPSVIILAAILGGLLFGRLAPEFAKDLGVVSKVLIQLVKALATPLVFLAISEAVIKYAIGKRDFAALLGLSGINAFCALLIGLGLANAFSPGEGLAQLVSDRPKHDLAQKSFADLVLKQIPGSIAQPFVENNILATVILAMMFGFALRSVLLKKQPTMGLSLDKFGSLLEIMREVAEKALMWVVTVMPLAVFAAIAQVTADQGVSALQGLIRYAAICLVGMSMHVALVYLAWVKFYAKIPLTVFFQEASRPILFAFGINSSLITLPLTLNALDRLGVNRRVSTLVSCIGTNFNNDGIVLYEVFTLIAIVQAYGMTIGLEQQILVALFCLVASLGVSGIPEAGIVALSLVLSSIGLPTEIIALLLSVDWLLARTRSAVNTCGDMAGSLVIERWQRPGTTAP